MAARPAITILLGLCLWMAIAFAEPAENDTDSLTDETAEYRQGGISQQLAGSYPMMGLYGANSGLQYMGSGVTGGGAGTGYVNMLRNLYRPPNFGLTDKVKHWVKSFMNRRQYVKPYYAPGLSYGADEFGGKPMVIGGNTYKAISVPLRQLQKYYKPYYADAGSAASGGQFGQPPTRGAAPASGSFVSYNSPAGAAGAVAGPGLYASESASLGHFNQGVGSPGLFASSGEGMFGSNPFGSSGSPSSGLFSSGASSGSLFGSGGSSGSGLFSSGDSGMFGAGSPYGASASGSSNIFSVDGSSYGASDNANAFYSSGAFDSAAASSLMGSSSGGALGDLYASGASSSSVYRPGPSESGSRGYGSGSSAGKGPYTGSSGSALYMSGSERNPESYGQKPAQEPVNSFNVNSGGRSNPGESQFSLSYQAPQGKSYSGSSGFQPVAFSSEDGGYKGFSEKSS